MEALSCCLVMRDANNAQRAKRATRIQWFVKAYGSTPKIYAKIWLAFQQTEHDDARIESGNRHLDLDYFLMSVYFLRKYRTSDDMESIFGHCPNTIRTWVWFYLRKIAALREEKIVWPAAWNDPESPSLPHFLISVDGVHTRCFERQTDEFNRDSAFYSHKFRSAGYGWEIGLSLWDDKVVSCRGPFPAGEWEETEDS